MFCCTPYTKVLPDSTSAYAGVLSAAKMEREMILEEKPNEGLGSLPLPDSQRRRFAGIFGPLTFGIRTDHQKNVGEIVTQLGSFVRGRPATMGRVGVSQFESATKRSARYLSILSENHII